MIWLILLGVLGLMSYTCMIYILVGRKVIKLEIENTKLQQQLYKLNGK